MRASPNQPCPCGSAHKLKRCCLPVIRGAAAPTAEALMRSRYTAYALGEVAHILKTTHPDGPQFEADAVAWAADVAAFCAGTRFVRLDVRAAAEQGDTATVTFFAHLEQGGAASVLRERSTFYKIGGRWLYHSGAAPLGALA